MATERGGIWPPGFGPFDRIEGHRDIGGSGLGGDDAGFGPFDWLKQPGDGI